jgi:hypothetical protein
MITRGDTGKPLATERNPKMLYCAGFKIGSEFVTASYHSDHRKNSRGNVEDLRELVRQNLGDEAARKFKPPTRLDILCVPKGKEAWAEKGHTYNW